MYHSFHRSSNQPQLQMLIWEMAKAFGEECNAKDWILHYDVCKLNNCIKIPTLNWFFRFEISYFTRYSHSFSLEIQQLEKYLVKYGKEGSIPGLFRWQ